MKKLLFCLAFFIFSVFIFGEEVVRLPDKNISVNMKTFDDRTLLYNKKPFTGKILVEDIKEGGYEGYFTFKNGKLDGNTELKGTKGSDNPNLHVKFTLVNGQYDGDLIYLYNKGSDMRLTYDMGKPLTVKIISRGEKVADIKFVNSLANGYAYIGAGANFKNGKGKVSGLGMGMIFDYVTMKVNEDNKIIYTLTKEDIDDPDELIYMKTIEMIEPVMMELVSQTNYYNLKYLK